MSNFWNKPKSLHELTDELVNRLDNPQHPNQGSGAMPQPPGVGGFGGLGAAQNMELPSNINYGQSAPGTSNSQPPKQQPSGGSWLDQFLAGRSKEELQELKYGLERASLAGGAIGVVMGQVAFLIDPTKLSVTIVLSGTALMVIGLQYLSSLVDEYMNKI